ncbi:MAG: hypothetical protein RIB84_03165 [Sneathiellaceae bacterium]
MATTSNNSPDQLREDLDRLRGDISALSSSFQQLMGDAGEEGVARAKNAVRGAKAKVDAGSDALEGAIVQRPLVSMLVALVIGMVIGKLFERR